MTGTRAHGWETAGGLAAAVLVGAVAWGVQRTPPVLAPPPLCPGALELVSVGLARAVPTWPLGATLATLNACLASAGLIAFVWLVARIVRSWPVAVAFGLAASALPLFEPRVSVPDAAFFLAAVLTWLALTHPAPVARHGRLAALGVTVSAACDPASAVFLMPVALWFAFGSGSHGERSRGVMVGVLLAVLFVAGIAAVPSWPGSDGGLRPWQCLLPPDTNGSEAWSTAPGLFEGVNLYIAGLAVLAVFTERRRWQPRLLWGATAYAIAPVLASAWNPAMHPHAQASAIVGLFVVSATGLGELVRVCVLRRGGWIAATFFVVLVPFSVHNVVGRAGGAAAEGQDAISVADVRTLVRALPDRSVLVIDDAVTDVLLRASLEAWRGTRKSLEVVSGPALMVPGPTFAGRAIHAFPRSRRVLEAAGFRAVGDANIGQLPLQRLEFVAACLGVPQTWTSVPDMRAPNDFAVISLRPEDEGPVRIYVASNDTPVPGPADWPPATTRGFVARVFSRPSAGAALLRLMEEEGVPASLRLDDARFVTRFELWRTPGAPRILRVHLNVPIQSAIVRLGPPEEAQRLSICPAY